MDDPRLVAQIRELEKLELEDEETLHVQPCFSPIWDTALVIEALSDAGLAPDDPILLKAGRWLLDREVKEVGDWKRACPAAEPGGWYFEYANEWYPDTDDTAEVLTALSRVHFPGESEDLAREGAVARGQAWMLAMQNRDGGWGAFDKDCDSEVLTYIPFADHNAMIDPSCEDITGRALEAFHSIGVPPGHPAVRRAADFIDAKQLPDGTWYGRWGCNYIYGSFLALRGLCTPARTCASRAFRRRPTGSARTRTPTAAGASCRTPTTTRRPRASGPRRRPRRRGRSSRSMRPATATPSPCAAASTTCWPSSSTTAPGRTTTGPPPDSRRCSTFATTSTPPSFRFAPSRSTRARRGPGPTSRNEQADGLAVRRTDHGVN